MIKELDITIFKWNKRGYQLNINGKVVIDEVKTINEIKKELNKYIKLVFKEKSK